MKRSKGERQGTRFIASRSKSERSRLNIDRVIHEYSEGDSVAIVIDGGQQKGMPNRRFQGKTGVISGKQGVAWVVIIKDGNKTKTVVARPEHIRLVE
jgi:large subunit ribosomal protein L21e